jgi:hypothetical protein
MKKLYRCYACTNERGIPGLDFEGEKPVCPKCEIDGSNKRFESLIVIREVIHFDAPIDHPTLRYEMGVNHAACDAKISSASNWKASGDPRAVTCPHCRDTKVFKDAEAGIDTRGVIPERDTVVESATSGGGVKFAAATGEN